MTTPKIYRLTPYNKETKEQIWGTIFTDAHDLYCGCTEPAAHFMSTLFPPDHPARNQTIDSFINNCFKRQQCLFGGKEEKGGTSKEETHTTEDPTKQKEKEEEPFADINIEDLLAAADTEDDAR